MTTDLIDREPVVALVVAAGSGVRLGGPVPKALRLLGGRPLVRHAVDALVDAGVAEVIVIVGERDHAAVAEALVDVPVPVRMVTGGAQRQDSVRRGLAAVGHPGGGLVLVHDAARPLVPAAVVTRVITALREGAMAVVPARPVTDSLRSVDQAAPGVVDRARLVAVQTPQGFDLDTLRRGHRAALAGGVAVTDDAAVCELVGATVTVVPGSAEALKVTEPFDLIVAEAILAQRRGSTEPPPRESTERPPTVSTRAALLQSPGRSIQEGIP